MDLAGFIDTYRDAIAQRVVESYPPLYWPSENGGKLPMLLRSPLGAQADAIRGAALSLEAHRGTTVVGEMGTGKTFIAASAAHMAGFKPTFPIWLNIPLSKSSAFFKPLSICETLAVGMAIITP